MGALRHVVLAPPHGTRPQPRFLNAADRRLIFAADCINTTRSWNFFEILGPESWFFLLKPCFSQPRQSSKT